MKCRDWYVGMKVVCVEYVRLPDEPPPYPSVGKVYTISWIGLDDDGYVLIDLKELPFPGSDQWHRGYQAHAFRPVQPRKTDISVFTAMLTEANQKAIAQ